MKFFKTQNFILKNKIFQRVDEEGNINLLAPELFFKF